MDSAELILLRATVRKLRSERKVMHEMLTEAGVRDDVLSDGVRTCLIGRLAIAIGAKPVDNSPVCTCTMRWVKGMRADDHASWCPSWK